MNEIEKFFGGLPGEDKQQQDVFDNDSQKNPVEKTDGAPENGDEKKGDDDEKGGEPRKNRRHRRLEEQLQRERESNIALAERIKVLAEVKRGEPATAGEMPPEWVALYGNSPESQNAWAMQERIFKQYAERAKTEALQEFETKQSAVVKQQKEFESFIDNELEALEDEYDVDLTSDAPAARKARRELLEMVQQLSPKDESGTIVGYADFGSTFELYRKTKTQEKPANETITRQKEIAAKTMQESGKNEGEKQTFTPGFRGWQKDYNLN